MIVFFFALQGCFAGGGINALNATYLAERFPTEVRATAGAFCSQQGAIFGALTAPILTFFAVNLHLGFAIPMSIGTIAGCASFIVALLFSPETRGKQLPEPSSTEPDGRQSRCRDERRRGERNGRPQRGVASTAAVRCAGIRASRVPSSVWSIRKEPLVG